MRTMCAVWIVAALLFCVSCTDTGLDAPRAMPYEVVGSEDLSPSNGRTARHWYIVSESTTFEEHAHTVVEAADDLHDEHGLDLTKVSLYPSEALAGSGVRYGQGYYAADGLAAQGLEGADPDVRATWRVLAADRVLTPEELAVAELWTERAPEFPSTDVTSSLGVDAEALRWQISAELGIEFEDVQLPHLELALWLEVTE